MNIEIFFQKVSKNWNKIKPFIPEFIIKNGINFLFWYIDKKDHKLNEHNKNFIFPPASLRYRVHGDPFLQSFLDMGKNQQKDLETCLSKIGRSLSSFTYVLDFGCGCGRTLIALKNYSFINYFGTDIDKEAIHWCRNNLSFVNCNTNSELPPCNYESDTFDLVYVISVFTHLNEELQFLWLEELKRITKPKGIVLLTIHNTNLLKTRLSKDEDFFDITKPGFVYRRGDFVKGTFPDWYQNAYHSEGYIKKNFSKYFKVLEIIPKGMNNLHDVVLLEKS